MTLVVILCFICLLCGIALSVSLFGTGGKRSKIFSDIYFSIEEDNGIAIVYTKTGEYSAIIKMENPVLKYSADEDSYYEFNKLMAGILTTIGDGYSIHKQDIFVRKQFDMSQEAGASDQKFLSDSYFRFFNGREYTDSETYLVITQENKKSALFSYSASKYRDFLVKLQKVLDQLHDRGIRCEFLRAPAAREYADRFFAVNFRDERVSMTNFSVDSNRILMGDRQCKVYSVLDLDNMGIPGTLRPYVNMEVNNSVMPVDLMSKLDSIPGADTVIYNQVIFVPQQKRELALLDKKRNRHASLPNPSNQIAVEDIKAVQDAVARDGKQLIYCHFNLIVAAPMEQDMDKITNYLENLFSRQNIHISKHAFNQLELFVSSFPGNCYRMNPEYDRFLTLSDAAICMMYKESQAKSEDTSLKCYYTDRQGIPLAIDITGKEGAIKHTNNSNFFVLGPSGSGKSFFMNTVCRQLYEQNTDMVIVDTGDSYEGISSYFGGVYISYSKERPISMNPFKVSTEEYTQNFGEKKNFLKSLIFLIFKGASEPTKIEDTIINQTIVEYYQEYFEPFKGFTDNEREEMRNKLLLEAKKSGEYDDFEEKVQERNGTSIYDIDPLQAERAERLISKLQDKINDNATTEGEKSSAQRQLQRLTPMIIEQKFVAKIEQDVQRIERQRKSLHVSELNFNSFYEFAVQRIPQLMRQKKVTFAIDEFAAILAPFYKGGELEYTLNNDMDSSLFDEKFIVFEIDKVKDDPILFPIIVLIIMDVFTQKMRIKKGRKCLVIEEAWKAIATPVMAEYIKYLYKTARKHWAMVGVVTQEIQDIISSPIVKEAIVSNSDVFMLLDQAKFKDKFQEIKSTLALNDIDCKKIFTINRLENKENRAYFKEVFIKRIDVADVYGVEEPRECYMAYTTEKIEKEALKLYKRLLHLNMQKAIETYVSDWDLCSIGNPTEFARLVNNEEGFMIYQEALQCPLRDAMKAYIKDWKKSGMHTKEYAEYIKKSGTTFKK